MTGQGAERRTQDHVSKSHMHCARPRRASRVQRCALHTSQAPQTKQLITSCNHFNPQTRFDTVSQNPVSKSLKHPRCRPNQGKNSIPLSQDPPPSSRFSNNNLLPLRTHSRSATFHGTCFRCWSYLLRYPSLDGGS